MHTNEAPDSVEVPPRIAGQRCAFDPNAGAGPMAHLLTGATRGDLAAHRALREKFTLIAVTPPEAPHAIMVGIEAIPYARFCAAHDEAEHDDARRLAGALCFTFSASVIAGYGDRLKSLMGEAVSILEQLAEEGDEVASTAALDLVGFYPPAAEIALRLMREGTN